MTTTTPPSSTDAEPEEGLSLGAVLLRSARTRRERVAVQALVEEETLLARDTVRTALVARQDGRMRCQWHGVAGRVFTLGLPPADLAFLQLVLSLLGIGHTPLSAAIDLDERRLLILLRALIRIAGNDRIAVGTRM
jgi:hypothetical protein